MRIFKYKSFSRFAEKAGITDNILWENNFTVAK
jgi:hypothetical protein